MSAKLEKFLQNLKKLENYWVLKHEKDNIIVGTKIIICEHRELGVHGFQPSSRNIDKELPIFFLVTSAEKARTTEKLFINNELPFLSINRKEHISTTEDVQIILDNYIHDTFGY